MKTYSYSIRNAMLLLCALAFLAGTQVVRATYLTSTNVQLSANVGWTTLAYWQTNGTGTAVAPVAGNDYEMVTNGVLMTTNLGVATCTTIRADTASAWPGNTLTIDANCQLKFKNSPITFTNAAGTNCLILKGGVLDQGNGGTICTITGLVSVASQSYLSAGSDGDGVGQGTNASTSFNISGLLSGSANLVIISSATNTPHIISNPANTFSGQWIIQAGWLQGTNAGSLGTNSITVDPGYLGYTNDMPSVVLITNSPTIFEPAYDLNSAGTLTLTNGGVMKLHQNCAFSAVVINGTSLGAGVYTYATLTGAFPANFLAGGAGSITVEAYNPAFAPAFAPVIYSQPQSVSVAPGSTATFSVAATGSSLTYQWYSSSSSSALVNATALVGASKYGGTNTSTLTVSNTVSSDQTNYAVIITNSFGSVTSSIASLTLPVPVLQLRMPFTDAAGGTTTPSDTSSGGINITMNMFSNGAAAWDLHGAAGTGVTNLDPNARALDMTTNTTASQGNGEAVTTTSAIADLIGSTTLTNLGSGNGNITNFAATIWAKWNAPYNSGASAPRLWTLYTGSTAVDNGAANSVGFQFLQTNQVQIGEPGSTVGVTLPTGNFPVGKWMFFALTYDGANYRVYYGTDTSAAQLINTTAAAGKVVALGSTASLVIGNRTTGAFNRGLNGWIQDFRFYKNSADSNFVESVRASLAPLPAFPVITTQPSWSPATNYTVLNQTDTVSVVVSGAPPLSYQWFTNSTAFPLSDNGNRIGSTSNVLTIPAPTGADGGNYIVIITNSAGAVTSSVAPLVVLPVQAATNFTLNFGGTSIFQGSGSDWNTVNNWNPAGLSATNSVTAYPGSSFELLPGAQLRSPQFNPTFFSFPGVQLTVDGNGIFTNVAGGGETVVAQIKFKANNNPNTNYFPLLVMAGGQLDNGGSTVLTNSQTQDIQGTDNIVSNTPIYVDSGGMVNRPFQIDAFLEGNGGIEYHDFSSVDANFGGLFITGTTNTYTGTWNVVQGPLVGGGANSLGTNTITIGANGVLETTYPVNNTNSTLVLNGRMFLTQTDAFQNVIINGTPLPVGTYSAAALNATNATAFPATFVALFGTTATSASGEIIVGTVVVGPPSMPHITGIHVSGGGLTLSATNGTPGGPWALLQSTNLALPYSQWQTNTLGSFDGSGNLSTNLVNTATNSREFYLLKVQ